MIVQAGLTGLDFRVAWVFRQRPGHDQQPEGPNITNPNAGDTRALLRVATDPLQQAPW